MYIERPLKDFISDTSSGSPTPGGGSVACLVGALGSSLLSMVGNFTTGKEKFKSVQKEVRQILDELESFTSSLCELIQEDISAYQSFSKLSSLPRTTPEEKKRRGELMQQGLKEAAQPPLRTCELSFKLIKVSSRLLEIGNPRLVSDVGVGAALARAVLESAALNVEINLSYIKDKNFVQEKRKSVNSLLEEGEKISSRVLQEVKKKIIS